MTVSRWQICWQQCGRSHACQSLLESNRILDHCRLLAGLVKGLAEWVKDGPLVSAMLRFCSNDGVRRSDIMSHAKGDNLPSDSIYYFYHDDFMSSSAVANLNKSCSHSYYHSHRVSRLYESQEIDLTFLYRPTAVRSDFV